MAVHRFVVIGAGRMGRNHIKTVMGEGRCKVAAIVEPHKATREAIAKDYKDVRVVEYVTEISPADFDAAIVSTTTQTHFEVMKQLLEFKKPVLLEKPIASTSKEGFEIADIAEKNHVPVVIGHSERMNPVVEAASLALEEGKIGNPFHYSFVRGGPFPARVTVGNDVLIDLMIHDLAVLALWEDNLIPAGSAVHSNKTPGIADFAHILLTSRKGNTASLQASWLSPIRVRTATITGTHGSLLVDFLERRCLIAETGEKLPGEITRPAGAHPTPGSWRELPVTGGEPLLRQLDQFLRVIEGKAHELSTAREGAMLLQLIEEAEGARRRE